MDCAQLVKENSIEGSKLTTTDVKYTPWSNLNKTADMDVGQIGFHDDQLVKTITVKKNAEIIRRLNKTKKQIERPDLAAEREERDRQERIKLRKQQREQRKQEKEEHEQRKTQAELRAYSSLMQADKMTSNKFQEGKSLDEIDDDFM